MKSWEAETSGAVVPSQEAVKPRPVVETDSSKPVERKRADTSGEKARRRGVPVPFTDSDVYGSDEVADQILFGMSPEERAIRSKRSDGTFPELPVIKVEGTPELESSQEERRRIEDQRMRANAAFRGDPITRGELTADRVVSATGGSERAQKARAQAELFRQTAEEAVDFNEKQKWMDRARRAEAGILAEDGDVDMDRIARMKESRKQLQQDVASDRQYEKSGGFGKFLIRLRERFGRKG